MRGTSNSNERGSVYDRRARREWVMRVWASEHKGYVRCYRCGKLLGGANKLTLDRIIPGKKGGTYARNNIRPACTDCNIARENE